MRIVQPSFEIEAMTENPLELIERAGRTCYKSEEKITEESAAKFVAMILKRGHLSVIEHASASVRFICDRGVSHEIVRHRLASYSQESTRYCNYGKAGEVAFIDPSSAFLTMRLASRDVWREAMAAAEYHYLHLISLGVTPQLARSVLPNSLKTEIVMTANFREWIHFFNMRTAPAAHPQMRELAVPLLVEFRRRVPVIFDSVGVTL